MKREVDAPKPAADTGASSDSAIATPSGPTVTALIKAVTAARSAFIELESAVEAVALNWPEADTMSMMLLRAEVRDIRRRFASEVEDPHRSAAVPRRG